MRKKTKPATKAIDDCMASEEFDANYKLAKDCLSPEEKKVAYLKTADLIIAKLSAEGYVIIKRQALIRRNKFFEIKRKATT